MKKTQRNRGITLIALVVTIIILIILAGFSINLILGENGIINRAKEAKLGTEIAREKEILQLAMGDITTGNEGKLYFDETSLGRALKNNSGIEGITVEKAGELLYVVTFPDSKRRYEVYADGTIENAAPKIEDTTPNEIKLKDDNDDSTYLIQSIEDLVILSNTVNAGTDSYEGKTFELECDLNFASKNSYIDATSTAFGDINGNGIEEALITELTTGAGFIPIGKYQAPFKGNIEGNNCTISNLYIDDSIRTQASMTALIGYVEGAAISIQNLELAKINLNGSSLGGLVSYIRVVPEGIVNIENCKVTGNIKSSSYSGGLVGSILDTNGVKINSCSTDVDISNGISGGFIGQVSNVPNFEINNSYNEGNISGTSNNGGFIALISQGVENLKINNSYNEGNISGTSNTGGFIGYISSTQKIEIDNSYNMGDIVTGANNGGIIGQVYAQEIRINNSYNKGNILDGNYVGGLFGYASGGNVLVIENCYNTGNMNSASTAGIMAWCDYGEQTITNCYNTGTITSRSRAGGIIERTSKICIITDCYNTGAITGDLSVGGLMAEYQGGTRFEINSSYNTGKITGRLSVGGIIGADYGIGTIFNCYNTGKIIAKSDTTDVNNVGGIVGQGGEIISNCYNTGDIDAKSDNKSVSYIGGICGLDCETILNCYNMGNINTKNNNQNTNNSTNVGGICGTYSTTISNCYNVGNITASGRFVGGIIGQGTSTVLENVYNLGNMTGDLFVGGIAGRYNENQYTKAYYLTGAATIGGGYAEDEAEDEDVKNQIGIESKDKVSIISLMNANLPSDVWEQGKNGEYPGLI